MTNDRKLKQLNQSINQSKTLIPVEQNVTDYNVVSYYMYCEPVFRLAV